MPAIASKPKRTAPFSRGRRAGDEVKQHDAHGNVTSMPHLSAMAWDFQNRLFSANNGTVTSYYNYDSTGNRASSDLIPNPSPARRRER